MCQGLEYLYANGVYRQRLRNGDTNWIQKYVVPRRVVHGGRHDYPDAHARPRHEVNGLSCSDGGARLPVHYCGDACASDEPSAIRLWTSGMAATATATEHGGKGYGYGHYAGDLSLRTSRMHEKRSRSRSEGGSSSSMRRPGLSSQALSPDLSVCMHDSHIAHLPADGVRIGAWMVKPCAFRKK